MNRMPFSWRGRVAAFVFFVALLFSFSSAPAQTAEPATPQVKLLTVGNSFSENALHYLPELAKAGGKNLIVGRASLGGHSLEQHVKYLQAYEANNADPLGSPYSSLGKLGPTTEKKISLSDALAAQQWTHITIQQYSAISFKAESFEPYGGILVEYLRKKAPGAEILVHETWAYREDSKLFTKEFTQLDMYSKLKANYEKLASTYGLRLLPSGDAFQAARQTPRWTYIFPDPAYDYAKPTEGVLPNQTGSLNVGWHWKRDKKTDKPSFSLDANHANRDGEYLAGAVWYEVLFNDNVEKVSYAPEGISAEDAAQLRHIAHETVAARAALKK